MFVQQFFIKGIAHSSYLLGGTSTCAIVDPRRDVHIYIDAAEEMGMTITHILETHLHADFVSGHLDLAEKTGAGIYVPEKGKCNFKHKSLSDGDTFEIEDMMIQVLETPGHTPEHISYVVTDRTRGSDPVAVFCGDTLFVGDVGRPDLFPGMAKKLASNLYESLHKKLLTLPHFCEVYPAHGAGSLCGRAMGAKRTSTIGYELKYNSALRIRDERKFIESLTTAMPPAPDHFTRLSAINRKGPALVETLPALELLDPITFKKKTEGKNTIVLDLRSVDAFGGQHVPGAYHIDFGGNFATFAGWILPPDRDILLVAHSFTQAQEASVWLNRVGLDRAIGYLKEGMFGWAKAGLPMGHVPQLSSEELRQLVVGKEKISLIDVRAPREYEENHIKGAVNIPLPDLRTGYKDFKRKIPIVLICSTGHRSSLGTSILKQQGISTVLNAAGGMTGYSAAGCASECPVCVAPHVPAFLGKGT